GHVVPGRRPVADRDGSGAGPSVHAHRRRRRPDRDRRAGAPREPGGGRRRARSRGGRSVSANVIRSTSPQRPSDVVGEWPDATTCALRVAEAMGLPGDVLQVVPGAAEAGRALTGAVDAVSFTGSAAVGHEVAVAAAGRGIPAQAEMGGQNPCIVLPDADVEATAGTIAASAMGYAGQKCTAARRVITVGPADAVRDALVAHVER